VALPDWLIDNPQVRHVHHRAAVPAEEAELPGWVPTEVRSALNERGLGSLWRHQREVAEHAWAGRHVAVATGTASGKTLAYLLPVMAATYGGPEASVGLEIEHPRTRLVTPTRPHTALYLAPTKALAHDQLRTCRELGLASWRVGALDGDSETDERRFARDYAGYVLTNPDMLHRSVLPHHARWAQFLSTLRYVVVDESHRYRGVFGTHVSAVLRRLRRLCAQYGSSPIFICASATARDAGRSAALLVGEPSVELVEQDASPHGALDFVLWEPSTTTDQDAATLMARLVDDGRQTLTFVGSRKMAELVSVQAQEQVTGGGAVASYRAGYLADDRRSIERQLQSGELMGVAATNALELGVDIAGMDAVVLSGFPGTLAALWQQAGRAGRRHDDALAVLVARENPLDAYLFEHPELVFEAPVESTVLHPDNPYILGPHLAAAAQEAPLTSADTRWFGSSLPWLADRLAAQHLLRKRPNGWFWTRPERAVDAIDLRSMGGRPFDIVDARTGRLIGVVDQSAVDHTVHEGAVYLHRGDQWLVDELREDEHEVLVHAERPGFYTQAKGSQSVRILSERERRPLGAGFVCRGDVELTSQVIGYLRRDEITHDVWDETPLDMPVRTLRTQAVWWVLPPDAAALLNLPAVQLAGAAHGAEHTAIGLLPVFAPCDRWDIGGLSSVLHPDTDACTVFVHDGHPGGSGFARRGFDSAEPWLRATLNRLRTCSCELGCPSCVVSPKCGNANQVLDKDAAQLLLAAFVEPASLA